MTSHLLRRLLQIVLVTLAMSLVIYGLIGLMPGDPIDLMLRSDPSLTAADAVRLKALAGLDQPLLGRWWRWLIQVAHGDLGYSRLYAVPVATILGPRLLSTLTLMGSAYLLALLLAVPAGVWAAARPGRLADVLLSAIGFAGISLPTFWLALLLIVAFAVELGWLPASGEPEPGAGAAQRLIHLVLPVATLAFGEAALLARYLRAAMRETLAEPFIRTARALGVGPVRLLLRHALRPASLPMVTLLGLNVGALFSGAVVVETVFARLGMGRLIYDAIEGSDYNLALAGLLLATLMTLFGNLLADLALAWLDPRVVLGAD